MHKLLEKLDKELYKYADREGELQPNEWKCVYDAIKARKDLVTSMAMLGEDQYGEYDNGEMSSGRYYYSNGGRSGNYGGNYSRMYMDPDLMYSRNGGYSGYNNGGGRRGSRTGGYSGHGPQDEIQMLQEMMDNAQTQDERMHYQKLIQMKQQQMNQGY